MLKKNGKLLITIRPKNKVEHLEFTRYGFKLYEAEDVKELLQNAGFSRIHWDMNDEPEIEIQGNKFRLQGLCIYGYK